MHQTIERTDAAALLTGPEAERIIALALTGGASTRANMLGVRAIGLDDRGERGAAGVFEVRTADGRVDVLVVSTDPAVPVGDGVVELHADGLRVTVWRRADDPALPALATASRPAAFALPDETPPRAATVELVSYRPGRRAVLRADLPTGVRRYVKVVRPHRAGGLAEAHRLASAAGIAPALLAASADGALLVADAAGARFTDLLAGTVRGALPTPGDVVELLESLPASFAGRADRRSWSADARHYARIVARRVRPLAGVAERLGVRIERAVARTDSGPLVPVHGDPGDANLFVARGRAVAFVDLDTVGPGHLVDDLACLVAHLEALHGLAPTSYAHVPALASNWRQAFARVVDPAALDARIGGVLLSLAAAAPAAHAAELLALAEARLDEGSGR